MDTYALMAMVFGELPPRAERVLRGIREGEFEGLVPPTVPYEFAVHWLRGRVPGLGSMGEVRAFFSAYFRVLEVTLEDYLAAAEIKERGDGILASSGDRELAARRLSLTDATVIRAAQAEGAPILTGDADLSYVAKSLGVEVVW